MKTKKVIDGKVFGIKSIQSFGYLIENVKNDVRHISKKGWSSSSGA